MEHSRTINKKEDKFEVVMTSTYTKEELENEMKKAKADRDNIKKQISDINENANKDIGNLDKLIGEMEKALAS